MIETKEISLSRKKLFSIYLKTLISKRWWSFLLIWSITIYQMIIDISNDLTEFFMLFSFIYPVVLLIMYYRFVASDTNRIFFLKRYYKLEDDKITGWLEDNSVTEIKKENIIKVTETKDYFLLYISQGQFLYLPNSSLDTEALDYLKDLKDRIKPSEPDKFELNLRNVLIGIFLILSLIPIWGLVAALGLLISILTLKKHIKLSIVFIVLSILSTTVTLLCTRNAFVKLNETGFQEQLVPASQERINELFPKIEYYKLIYRKYPESLEELQLLDPNPNIRDFSYQSTGGYNPEYINFYYTKIDTNRYILLGLGKDSIPGTEDDIIPEITKTEAVITGLNRYRLK